MTLQEAKQALCRKLNIDYDDVVAGNNQLFSESDLEDYINSGAHQAWDLHPWTFTEKTYQFTITSGMLSIGYVDYPSDFEDESAYRFEIPVANYGEFEKKDFKDYQKWFNDYPTDTSKIWSEHERFIFFNPNAVAAGLEADISGKRRMTTLSGDSDLLPFSPSSDNQENSGNEAIIRLSYAKALGSEKKKNPNGAKSEEKAAIAMLEEIWKPIGELRAQKTSQNRPFFNTVNLFNSNGPRGNNTNIGNFP